MKYPRIRYVQVRPDYHLLHSYDGTCRGVVFASQEVAMAALVPGRADMDVVAIGNGFLPRGAILVSRAGAGDIDAIMTENGDAARPDAQLARIRLAFSLKLLTKRSELISRDEDAAARSRYPVEAKRYEGIVDELVRFNQGSGGS